MFSVMVEDYGVVRFYEAQMLRCLCVQTRLCPPAIESLRRAEKRDRLQESQPYEQLILLQKV